MKEIFVLRCQGDDDLSECDLGYFTDYDKAEHSLKKYFRKHNMTFTMFKAVKFKSNLCVDCEDYDYWIDAVKTNKFL